MLRHKRILYHNGITIGPLHADDMPFILYPVVRLREKEHRPLGFVSVLRRDLRTDRHPVAAPQTAQEAPSTAKPVSSRDWLGFAHGSKRVGHHHIGIFAPDFLLQLWLHIADPEIMDA